MAYWVVRKRPNGLWRSYEEAPQGAHYALEVRKFLVPRAVGSMNWSLVNSFGSAEDAIEAAQSAMSVIGYGRLVFGVREGKDGLIVWASDNTTSWPKEGPGYEPLKPQEVPMGIPTQTLNVSRDQVIQSLEARAADEAQKREDAQAAITKRRQAAQDAVASLSPDEMLNLVLRSYSDLDGIVAMVEEAHESGRLKSVDQKPGPVETAIGKYLRVLQMATDSTIELTPSDDLYGLL